MRFQHGFALILQTAWTCLAWAQTPGEATRCSALNPGNTRFSEGIGIVHSASVPDSIVEGAVARWATCPGYGTDFPAFIPGGEGTQSVEVRFARRGVGPRCGSFAGRTIVLYAFARDSDGRLRSCGSRADGLAHELGHVLGLRDAPDRDSCRDHAMAWIDVNDRDGRRVDPEECRVAGERWQTPAEVGTDIQRVFLASVE